MYIKITRPDGMAREFNGDVSYDEAVVIVKYVPDNGDIWREIVIPWHVIQELEIRP